MKKKGMVVTVLLLIALTSTALAGKVRATDSVNVRSGPGLSYGIIETVLAGNSLEYTGQTEVDDRGVAWYSVDCYGQAGWISEKYSILEGDASTSGGGSDTSNDDPIDLSRYIGADLQEAGTELNLASMANGEGGSGNLNDYILLGTDDGNEINSILIFDEGPYALFGMEIGQPRFEAEGRLAQNGYTEMKSDAESGIYVNSGDGSAICLFFEGDRLNTIHYLH